MGFPREYQVCHKPGNGISDMGAPTYWRLGRLQTQMTSEGTKDTTQEPEVTYNHSFLVSPSVINFKLK